MNFLGKSLVPEPYALLYRILAWMALVMVVFLYGNFKGASRVHAQWDAQVAKQAMQVAKITQRSTESTLQTVTVYVQARQKESTAQSVIQTEVPVYVPSIPITPDCPGVSRNFVLLWNAANSGVPLPATPDPADGAAAGVEYTDLAAQHAEEAALCRSTEQKLSALQSWVVSQQKIFSAP